MSEFIVKDYVFQRNDSKWMDKLNKLKTDKPLFIIINRAYLTSKSNCIKYKYKYKYQELKCNIPKFVILDECHSAMANRTYQLLLFIKHNWKANIQGLSATPYRKGQSYTSIDVDIDYPDKDLINTNKNENKLIQIFHKRGNINELNILSWFNLKEAIEKNIILEPIFHWFHIKQYIKKKKNKNYLDNEIASVMSVLNDIINKCPYKKCIVWCRLKDIADNWFSIFNKEKSKYNNLQNIKVFIDHSYISRRHYNDYNKFYHAPDDAIMFCASKYREGSDIPYLSCCLFLDKVKNRGELPFIQCIGRVLRKDNKNLKKNGHIIDGCTITDDKNKMKDIINKLIKYYLNLYEFAKSDFEKIIISNKDIYRNKLKLYNSIMHSLRLEPDKKKIYIDLENNKKITLNLEKLNIKTMEWNKIIPKFEKILKNNLIMSDYEEFLALKKKVIQLGIKNVYDYDEKWIDYKLYTIDDQTDEIIKINPRERFPSYFKNWYDFLDRETNKYIKDKIKWKIKCDELGLNKYNYLKKIKNHPELPDMPQDFYHNFTNLSNELSTPKNHEIL
jgi:hypothetical protein